MDNVIDIEEAKKKTSIGERHIYTQEMIKRLRDAKIGEIVKYDELNAIIGMETRARGPGYNYQKSARDILERDEAIVFEPVENIGLRRMSSEEVALSSGSIYLQRKKSIIKRSVRRVSSIDDDFDRLSPDAQFKVTVARTMIAFDTEMVRRKKISLIEGKVKDTNKLIGFNDTIGLFKK